VDDRELLDRRCPCDSRLVLSIARPDQACGDSLRAVFLFGVTFGCQIFLDATDH
jgi:hypothetical protein